MLYFFFAVHFYSSYYDPLQSNGAQNVAQRDALSCRTSLGF